MATIKSYTTIEQSRKLAEILTLESADMCWQYQKDRWVGEPDYKEFPQFEHATDKRDIPCWSLAALIGVLPSHFYDKTGRKTLGMDKGDTYFNIFYENKNSYIQKSADNPIDACYEMIIKLNELNLL